MGFFTQKGGVERQIAEDIQDGVGGELDFEKIRELRARGNRHRSS